MHETIAEYLSIPEEVFGEFEMWDFDLGHSEFADGDESGECYFYVPEHASDEILSAMNWKRDQCIYLPTSIFNEEELD